MSDHTPMLMPRAAFADLPMIAAEQSGVVVSDRDGLGLATVLVRRGQHESLARRVRDHFGIELSRTPCRRAASGIAFIATAPGAWLALSEEGGNAFVQVLTEAISDAASICDQSDGYAVLRLSGRRVRDALCRLVPVDLHPSAFKVGDAATTIAAHIGATLWRLDDATDGSAVFEIAVYRSFAGSLWSALSGILAACRTSASKPSCSQVSPSSGSTSSPS